MENWDDLRLFLATARPGSSRGAARGLGIKHTVRVRALLRHLADGLAAERARFLGLGAA